MTALEITRKMIRSCLQLDESVSLSEDTYLMGGFPEFNSLTITTLIVEIEDNLGCEVADDEISGEIFETVGSLAEFVEHKMKEA
ncbi:MAG: phosphopantetheine-binding protein [Halieaceae bacterium]|uniref:phosphopantetheine-binding protein n=1 Tax=Haliea alexandrii TaxID=2448162 RepID=UPI0018EEA674|nr:phosphopantetheine-binding protein [Haliea alexandrii]MCR9186210.1 phosphopantetheine-binding protein [Halieaceae bacterium]